MSLNGRKYYILSLKWSRGGENLTWWGPDDCGYVTSLDVAGKYTHEQVTSKAYYYNNYETSIAVPTEDVERHIARVVPDFAFKHFTRGRKYFLTDDGLKSEETYAKYYKNKEETGSALQLRPDGEDDGEQESWEESR